MVIYRTAKQRFLDRFDPRDGGWVYRATDRSPGRWASDAERDRMATRFGECTVLLYLALITDLPMAVGVVRITTHPSGAPQPRILTGLVVLLIAFPTMAALWRAAAAWIALRGRAFIDDGPTKEDRRRRKAAKETFVAIANDVVFSLTTIIYIYSIGDSRLDHWRFWIVGATISANLLYAAFRIRRLRHREREAWCKT